MIDLQKFCATDTDPRPHIRKPTRCADGIVATNGQILICVPDDGRECDSTKDTIAAQVAKFHHGLMGEDERRWFDVTAIALPPKVICTYCGGKGYSYQVDCEDCDGDGEFDHGQHTYCCKECDGEGSIKTSAASDGAKKYTCAHCAGTGEDFQAVFVGGTHFRRRYLAMLADLPGCRIGLSVEEPGTAVYRFDGGWGALMPCRGAA